MFKTMLLIIFLLLFLFNINTSFANVFYMLPDGMNTKNINSSMKKKTMNRNENVMYQMNNQYKGKLKYRSPSNMIKSFREKRYYTSAYYLHSDMEIAKLTSNRIKYSNEDEKNKFKDYYGAAFGYYLRNSIGVEVEYFELYRKSASYTDDFIIKFLGVDFPNIFELSNQNFFLNFFVESNYAKLIPFLGVGAGAVKSKFKSGLISGYFPDLIEENEGFISHKTTLKSKIIPVFQFFAGFEFAINENLTFFAKYKYYSLKKNLVTERIVEVNKKRAKQDYTFTLEGNSFINVGFKFLW